VTARALVTGASGMLGAYIADALGEQGWSVRALVRSAQAARAVHARGLEPVEGSLEDAGSLLDAAHGCEVVFHAAAAIGAGGDLASFRRANVLGTQNVLDAAAGVSARLVHVSSTAVYGASRYREAATDEDAPLPTLPPEDAYGRSKQDAEAAVLAACRGGRAWATIVRPPMMYGIRDRQMIPRLAPLLARGFFPSIGGGRTRLTLVHARNVADGAVLAAGRDTACGRIFLLADDFPVTLAALLEGAGRGHGRPVVSPPVPRLAGRWGFDLGALGLRAAGRADLAYYARGTFDMLTRDNPFTSGRARGELGWNPAVTPEVGIEEAFAWWRRARAAGRPTEEFPASNDRSDRSPAAL
jgi:nucleoside-diphosphate-sugar epimerase